MVQSWTNTDNLYIKFGTSKTTAENWGDYRMPGGSRVLEGLIDVSTLTTVVSSGVAILSDTILFPPAGGTGGGNSNSWYIEKVETAVETAISSTVGTISVGLIQTDRVTVPTSYSSAILAALISSDNLASSNGTQTYFRGTTGAGNFVGITMPTSAALVGPFYLTGTVTTAGLTGKLRVRIHYRGIGTITQ